jgi:DNA-binding XRE family transcriptional regulator
MSPTGAWEPRVTFPNMSILQIEPLRVFLTISPLTLHYFAVFCIMPRRRRMRSKELRGLRLQKRLTQTEVAKKMGVSQAYYSQIERGDRPTELVEAAKVVNTMRTRTDRTAGGDRKAGRQKG